MDSDPGLTSITVEENLEPLPPGEGSGSEATLSSLIGCSAWHLARRSAPERDVSDVSSPGLLPDYATILIALGSAGLGGFGGSYLDLATKLAQAAVGAVLAVEKQAPRRLRSCGVFLMRQRLPPRAWIYSLAPHLRRLPPPIELSARTRRSSRRPSADVAFALRGTEPARPIGRRRCRLV